MLRMPFVKRNLNQQIVALSIVPDDAGTTGEFLPDDHPALQQFLTEHIQAKQTKPFADEDLALVRVLEDLVDLLIERNVITFSELPMAAQHKLLAKKGLRERLIASTSNLLVTDKPLL